MSKVFEEHFYQLLPTLYHRRDMENGEALRALLIVLEEEFRALEKDISATYNNWFIQTCDDWVIPYFADLVGVRGLSQAKHLFSTQRRQIANAIGYRRRKGTLPVLEHILRDVTNWMVCVVEYSNSIGYSQKIAHSTFNSGRAANLKNAVIFSKLEMEGVSAHTLNLHSVSDSNQVVQYKYGLNEIGIYIWRLRSYLVKNSPIHPKGTTTAGLPLFYTVDPLGRDTPLFNFPRLISEIDQKAAAVNMPIPLTGQLLKTDIENYKTNSPSATGNLHSGLYYGPNCGLCVMTNDGSEINPGEIVSMNLSKWTEADQKEANKRFRNSGKRIGIDVASGRLVIFDDELSSRNVKVNYCYGFGGEIGGGPYHRKVVLGSGEPKGFNQDVAKGLDVAHPGTKADEHVNDGSLVHTLGMALNKWNTYCQQIKNQKPIGIIRILDNGVYGGNLVVNIPPGSQLSIVADNGVRPTLRPIGNITVNCIEANTAIKSDQERMTSRLQFDGLLINGGLQVISQPTDKNPLELTFQHCTLMPNGIKVIRSTPKNRITVNIEHSIVGSLQISNPAQELNISDSIIDHSSGYAIAGDKKGTQPCPKVVLNRATIFGKVFAEYIQACDVLFTDELVSSQYDLRFCYVPDESLNIPQFTSTRFGDPGYAQLSHFCPKEILTGGSEQAEIGVFHNTYRSQAEMNIQNALDEFMPLGITAGIFYRT